MVIKLKGCTGEQFAKRALKLMYDACGSEFGSGFLRRRVNPTEDEIWANSYYGKDYDTPYYRDGMTDEEVHADYVFGRMIKWGCKWDRDTVELSEEKYDPDWNGFANTYPHSNHLIAAVCLSLGAEWSKLTTGGVEKRN